MRNLIRTTLTLATSSLMVCWVMGQSRDQVSADKKHREEVRAQVEQLKIGRAHV